MFIIHPPRQARWALMIASLAAVAACGGSGSSGSSGSADPGADGTDEAAPLLGPEEFGLTTEELAVRIEQVEAAIGECMQAAGFEYVPVDFETVYDAMGSSGSAPGLSDEEYLAQFGFGITTRVGLPDPVVVNGQGEQNVAIYDSLAPNDQVAYEQTLWGDDADATLTRALEDEDFSSTGGCTRAAAEQHFSGEELSGAYHNPADARIESDPRMIDALAEWSACMTDAGFPYPTPDALDDELADRLDAILQGQPVEALTASAQAELSDLQGFERAVAPISEDCEEEHIVPVEEEIESEIYGAPQN